jgi:hypothetical protein
VLNFYEDSGFDSEDELIEYVESLRDLALLSDDDSISSFVRDLSATFADSDRGTNKFSHHEFLDGQEMKTISEGSNWLIPIQHVFVNIRYQKG